MKTKLLKIVRKRYEIVKVTKFREPPVYRMYDKSDDYFTYTSKSLEEAMSDLIAIILIDYKDTSKKRRTRKEKIWYEPNIK